MPSISSSSKANKISIEKAIDTNSTREFNEIARENNGIQFFEGQCTVRVASQFELRHMAYSLLYEIYSKTGLAKKNSNGLWLSIYDALPDTTTFIAQDKNAAIEGALTSVFDSPIGLPADELYKKEVNELRNSGRRICEFISLGINYKVKYPLKILAILFYCAFLHAWQKKKSTDLIITVHPRYEDFYCRKLSFKKIGIERNYPKVNDAPAVLLNLSLGKINRLRHEERIFPFTMLNYPDQQEFEFANKIEKMIRPMTDEEFFAFFIENTNKWKEASSQQKDFIKEVYPASVANHYGVSRAFAKAFSKKNQYNDDNRNNPAKKDHL